jgi:hypothetical protein
MSFKDEVKNLIIASLDNSPQKVIINDLKIKIRAAIDSENLPVTVEQDYPVEWDNEDTNKLQMLIKSDIGVDCNLNNGVIVCPLILFFD